MNAQTTERTQTMDRPRYRVREGDRRLATALQQALAGSQQDIRDVIDWFDAFLPGQPKQGYDAFYLELLEWALFWKVDGNAYYAVNADEIRQRLQEAMPDIRTFLTKGDGKKEAGVFLRSFAGALAA